LVRKISAAGFVTVEAGDGLAALECLRKQTVDFIFTDLDMPQMGGLELLADLQRGPHSHIPVVVVSGRAEQDFQDRAEEAGAIDFLVKPATDEQLTGVLEKLTATLADV
jgi:CheY-like chemotaxis protein